MAQCFGNSGQGDLPVFVYAPPLRDVGDTPVPVIVGVEALNSSHREVVGGPVGRIDDMVISGYAGDPGGVAVPAGDDRYRTGRNLAREVTAPIMPAGVEIRVVRRNLRPLVIADGQIDHAAPQTPGVVVAASR